VFMKEGNTSSTIRCRNGNLILKMQFFNAFMQQKGKLILTFSRQRLACLAAMAFLNSWESGYNMEWCGCTEGKRFLSSCSATMLTSFFMRAS
jgi:hypothetical protein